MSATVGSAMHRALGRLVRLTLPGRAALDLTPREAATLSRALAAVAEGRSLVDEVFLSPIASDGEFHAAVGATGVTLAGEPLVALDWPAVRALAAALAAEAGPDV